MKAMPIWVQSTGRVRITSSGSCLIQPSQAAVWKVPSMLCQARSATSAARAKSLAAIAW